MNYKTEQEGFWAGEFGNDYINRNNDVALVASNLALFAKVFQSIRPVASVLEFGANIGLNLRAIHTLLPQAQLAAIEINSKAVQELKKNKALTVYHTSILDFKPDFPRDFVFIKGVLIHINPDMLAEVYAKLYQASQKYILVAEYYNPTPVEVEYRGHRAKLFKRDFAGDMLDIYPDLKLVDYGFTYHRDENFEQDDTNWFLLEKC